MAKKHAVVAAFRQRVLAAMEPGTDYTAAQLAARLSVSAPTVRGALKYFCEAGTVKKRMAHKLMIYSRPSINRTPGAYIAPWKPLTGYHDELHRHANLAMEGR